MKSPSDPSDLRQYLMRPVDLGTPSGLADLRSAFFAAFQMDEAHTKRELLFNCLLELSGRDLSTFVADAILLADLARPEEPPPSPYEALVPTLIEETTEVYLAAPPLIPDQRVSDAVRFPQLIPWILMGAYMYGHHGVTIIPDQDFDAMCQWLDMDFDVAEHPHKRLIRKEALSTCSFRYLSASDYPTIVKFSALQLWARMSRLNLSLLDAMARAGKGPLTAADRMDIQTALQKVASESPFCM